MRIDLPIKSTPSLIRLHLLTFTKLAVWRRQTLAQATQTSALLNHSYVSNYVFDTFYVDYLEFKKYMDDIINILNIKNAVCEKSHSNKDQSKLQFLQAEILKLRNENTSLKDDNKSN